MEWPQAARAPWVVVAVQVMVGKVSQERYQQVVAESRELVAAMARCQWRLGDLAVEIEPMRSHGGSSEVEEGFGVQETLRRFAEDIGLAYTTVRTYRWVASRWPVQRRRDGVSHTVHRILAAIPDEQARFEAIGKPPAREGATGELRWTHDAAKRAVGWKVESPETVQERVEAIHDLAREDAVAAVVVTDLLRRPVVAAKAMADDTARHLVNDAQWQRFRQQSDQVRDQVPALQRIEHSADYLDLVAACAQFVPPPAESSRPCAGTGSPTTNAPPSTAAWPGCGPRRSGSRAPSPPAT